MKLKEIINEIIPSRYQFVNRTMPVTSAFETTNRAFADMVWLNCCELLTDLCDDVTLTYAGKAEDAYKFGAFKAFFYMSGAQTMQTLFDNGFAVIGYNGINFWIMDTTEYRLQMQGKINTAKPINPQHELYVMRSSVYAKTNKSDKQLALPWLQMLDDIANASNTITKRMGVVVVASPKNNNNVNVILTKSQKEEIEKELRTDYGALRNQSQVMVLPREMNWETINLAGLDLKAFEKIRYCVQMLCDRIKVPANQVSFIDANASKALSNGSELREGDKLKYKAFRRLFERTFADMARNLNILLTYTIDGEPI